MTNTTNYNLLLAEGTDLVNYLTQTNPNFSNLDSIIKGVSDLTTTPATEVTTGTAHAISKSLPDATVIKFTATSNWQTGDTMTLDGNPVTPLKTDGTTLKTGDYIIGSAVLMIQDGTRLTVLVASSPDAGDINYDNTVSGLTANKVQGAIDENAAAINTINSNLSGKISKGVDVYGFPTATTFAVEFKGIFDSTPANNARIVIMRSSDTPTIYGVFVRGESSVATVFGLTDNGKMTGYITTDSAQTITKIDSFN